MVTLYSTGCPQCNVLKQKLDMAKVDYEVITDQNIMIEKGFQTAPVLDVDGVEMNAPQAFRWLAERGN